MAASFSASSSESFPGYPSGTRRKAVYRVLTKKQCAQELLAYTKQQAVLIEEMMTLQKEISSWVQRKYKTGLSKAQEQWLHQKQDDLSASLQQLTELRKQISKLQCSRPMSEYNHKKEEQEHEANVEIKGDPSDFINTTMRM